MAKSADLTCTVHTVMIDNARHVLIITKCNLSVRFIINNKNKRKSFYVQDNYENMFYV